MRTTTNYKGVKIHTATKDFGTHKSTFVHIIGPRFHKISKVESGWLQKAIEYIDLRHSGQLHPKIKI